MKIENWAQARARLTEARPDLDGAMVFQLWESPAGRGGSEIDYGFAVDDGHAVMLVWVGPRGGVSTAMRYTHHKWRQLVAVFGEV